MNPAIPMLTHTVTAISLAIRFTVGELSRLATPIMVKRLHTITPRVMSVVDGRITFHILTSGTEGNSQAVRVSVSKIIAYIDPLDRESTQALEVVFSGKGNEGESTFVSTIPESFQNCKRLSVVVPKIELGGERLSFSFTVSQDDAPSLPEKATKES